MIDFYFKFKLFKEIVIPTFIIIVLLIFAIISFIKFKINKKFKKNCFKCKHYNLFDVASVGNRCRYKCNKLNRMDSHNMNNHYNFIKCKLFETKM